MDKKTRALALFLFLLIGLSIILTYHRMIVLNDYERFASEEEYEE